jgi:hypothetical protein
MKGSPKDLPLSMRRAELGRLYGLDKRRRKSITRQVIEQLDRCQSEEARRLILGASRRITEPQST